MDYNWLHEAEEVSLVSQSPRHFPEVGSILLNLGYTLHEDVFSLDRPGPIPPWQSESYVEVYILSGQSEVYEPSDTWDTITLAYLLATQPRSGIAVFVSSVSRISELLGLAMRYRGTIVSAEQLTDALNNCADELQLSLGEPGEELVAIFIASTYPRQHPL